MSWLLAFALLTGTGDLTTVGGGAPRFARTCEVQSSRTYAERAVKCRWECVCFRVNGYRCRRYYTETCPGKACWQCQSQLTERARKSCSIGSPVKTCWCKFNKL